MLACGLIPAPRYTLQSPRRGPEVGESVEVEAVVAVADHRGALLCVDAALLFGDPAHPLDRQGFPAAVDDANAGGEVIDLDHGVEVVRHTSIIPTSRSRCQGKLCQKKNLLGCLDSSGRVWLNSHMTNYTNL